MKKFTEGKWELLPDGCIEVDSGTGSTQRIAEVMDFYTVDGDANARLIALAPEMYETITKLIDGVRTAKLLNGLQIAKVNPALIASAKNLLARIDGTEDENV